MYYLIVEDQAQPVELWLAELAENADVPEEVAGEARALRAADIVWARMVDDLYARFIRANRPLPDIPDVFRYICEKSGALSNVYGIRGCHIVILLIVADEAANLVEAWLQDNLPSSCLSFLDYKLAEQEGIAERLAPLLARGPKQLCVNHSSVMADLGVADDLGLSQSKRLFYKNLPSRLVTTEGAKKCVSDAISFWDAFNKSFTETQEVDVIISGFIEAQVNNWDGAPFHHNILVRADSMTCNFVDGAGFEIDDAEDRQGLFMCKSVLKDCKTFLRRCYSSNKKVSGAALNIALKALGLSAELIDIDENCRWAPPFTPSVLLLCQLRLMMEAFSDTKEAREAPELKLARNRAEFVFKRDIAMANWRARDGNSCQQMQAMEKACLGLPDEFWRKNTSASLITMLLNGRKDVITVRGGCKEVTVSWEV